MDLQITPKKLSGAVTPPSSKSQAHRLLIAAALSGGISVIHGLADSQDIRATRRCLSAMCAGMEDLPDGTLRVHGLGNGIVIAPPYALLDCGESGSTLRFLIPVGLLIQGEASFTGRGRLMERPLKPYEDLFREKGIAWKLADNVLTVNGGRGYGTLALDPGTYRLPGNVSSQFFTGLLFVMPLLEGDSTLVSTTPLESRDYLEMTRQAQAAAGVTSRWLDENTLFVPGGQTYQSFEATAEADWSQAGFWYAADFLDSRVDIRGLNPVLCAGGQGSQRTLLAAGPAGGHGDRCLRMPRPAAASGGDGGGPLRYHPVCERCPAADEGERPAFHHRRPADRPGRTGGGGAGLSDSPRRDAHRRHGGLRQRPPDRHGGRHRRHRLYRPRHGAGGPMRAEVLPGFLGGVQEPGR